MSARKRRILLAVAAGLTSTALSSGARHGDYWLTIVSAYVLVIVGYLFGRVEERAATQGDEQ